MNCDLRLCQSRSWFDRFDAEGVRLILVPDCHIFTRHKHVRTKTVSSLVIINSAGIVVEHPAGVLLSAWLMDDLADLVVFALPEAADPAVVAM